MILALDLLYAADTANRPAQEGSTLVGPAGGLETSWNQYADEDSSGVMVDSTGVAITVTVATNFSEGRAVSPSSFGYHWNHNGESQYLNGTAMGAKMLEILAP